MIEPTPRLHTPSFERLDVPEGYAACLDCPAIFTVDQLFEERCPGRRHEHEP